LVYIKFSNIRLKLKASQDIKIVTLKLNITFIQGERDA